MPGSNEMMKLIVADITSPRGHRLHTLAVTRTDQTCNIKRAHPAPRWMRKSARNGASHRSRSIRQVSSTTIAVDPSAYTDTTESTTIPVGSFNLPK